MKTIDAWEAVFEKPEVLCSYGRTPAKALKEMSKLMKEREDDWASGISINYSEDEEVFFVTVYI